MSETSFLAVKDGRPIKLSDLPHLVAAAMHPDDAHRYETARLSLEGELTEAARHGQLLVRDPASLAPLRLGVGALLQNSVVLPHDLVPWLAEKGIGLRVIEPGNVLVESDKSGALFVRLPGTDSPYRPRTIREFYDLAMPAFLTTWSKASSERFTVVDLASKIDDSRRGTIVSATNQPNSKDDASEVTSRLAKAAAPAPVRPIQREAAHDANVLAALRQLGFDPKKLPKAPPGKPSPAKSAARAALEKMTAEVFKKAWQRLRAAGEIGEA
jgi:hypothetical protein